VRPSGGDLKPAIHCSSATVTQASGVGSVRGYTGTPAAGGPLSMTARGCLVGKIFGETSL
jgi:hypothetical protein